MQEAAQAGMMTYHLRLVRFPIPWLPSSRNVMARTSVLIGGVPMLIKPDQEGHRWASLVHQSSKFVRKLRGASPQFSAEIHNFNPKNQINY